MTDETQTAANEAIATTDQAASADQLTSPAAEPAAEAQAVQSDAATETHESEAGDVVTVSVARGIFEQRHDVASVVTDQGILHRDGTLT